MNERERITPFYRREEFLRNEPPFTRPYLFNSDPLLDAIMETDLRYLLREESRQMQYEAFDPSI